MKLIRVIQSKIVKKDNKYQVQSEKGKNLGTYNTKSEAEKRLKQVEMFKHMKSKELTMEDVNKMYEDAIHKDGFPTDEQIQKMFEQYNFSKEHNYRFKNPFNKDPKSWQELKDILLDEYLAKDLVDNKKVYYGDEWEETEDEDPITEPKDIQI